MSTLSIRNTPQVPGFHSQSGLTGGLGAGASTYVSGAVGSQVGTAIAQEIGFDYFAISQGDLLSNEEGASFLNTAQFEVGRYLGDDVFVVFVLGDNGDRSPDQQGVQALLRGARVELALTEEWFVEGFWEDLLLRNSSGLGQTGLEGQKVVGLLFFRDWGYGSQ